MLTLCQQKTISKSWQHNHLQFSFSLEMKQLHCTYEYEKQQLCINVIKYVEVNVYFNTILLNVKGLIH